MPRKSGYTPEIGERICELLADGASLRDIAGEPGMPPRETIRRWGVDARYSDEEFLGRYARATIAGCHAQFEELREIQRKLLDEEFEKPENARIALDTIKWRLSKMLPGVYGERTHIEHSGTIKHETVKDHAPEWMQDKLTAPDAAAETDEAETLH